MQDAAVAHLPAPSARRYQVMKRLARRPPALIAAAVVAAFVVIALAAPLVEPYYTIYQIFLAIRMAP
jgi:hypothetical protein